MMYKFVHLHSFSSKIIPHTKLKISVVLVNYITLAKCIHFLV